MHTSTTSTIPSADEMLIAFMGFAEAAAMQDRRQEQTVVMVAGSDERIITGYRLEEAPEEPGAFVTSTREEFEARAVALANVTEDGSIVLITDDRRSPGWSCLFGEVADDGTHWFLAGSE